MMALKFLYEFDEDAREPDWTELHRLFDHVDGILIWKTRPVEDFATVRGWKVFNTRFAGKEAGTWADFPGGKRRTIGIDGKSYLRYRLIWIYVNRLAIPADMMIDHIDGDCTNDLPDNLRLASSSENQHNRHINNKNTSGYKGVSYSKRTSKWRAKIHINNRTISLGYFNDPESAHAAYCEASEKLHRQFGNTGIAS